jgi:uncharacterized membrane protein
MTPKMISLSLIVLFCISCKQQSSSTSSSSTDTLSTDSIQITSEDINYEQDSLESGDYCYRMTQGRDTTTVSIRILSSDDIRGEMIWSPYEEHGAVGKLTGKMISAREMELKYVYTIEGSEQSEIKVMKIEASQLWIKVGPLVDPKYDGQLTYKDVASAQYTQVLDQVDCEQ